MSASRYVLARFSDPELFDDAVEVVRKTNGVRRWDAVDGYYQMIVKTDDQHSLDLAAIKQNFHLSELIDLKVGDDHEPQGGVTREDSFSYLWIETHPQNRAAVREALGQIENNFAVNAAEGPYDTLVLLKGGSFAELNRVIEDRVVPLAGVLRFKQSRIISSNPV